MDYSKLDFYKNYKGAKQRSCGGSGRSRRNKVKQLSFWKEEDAALKNSELEAQTNSKEGMSPPPPPVDVESPKTNFVGNFEDEEDDIEDLFMPLPSKDTDNQPNKRTTEIPPPPPLPIDDIDDISDHKRDTALSGSKQNEDEKSEKLAKSKSDFSLNGDNLNRGSKFMFEASVVRNEPLLLKKILNKEEVKEEDKKENRIYRTLSI